MDVVCNIRGREAIPVWTIPYIASHHFSADMLLHGLTDTREVVEVPFPSAFIPINFDGYFIIPPAQWSELRYQIELLEEDANNILLEHESRIFWNQKSVELFWQYEPSYIWLDEFRSWYTWHIENEFVYDKDDDVQICLSPRLPESHARHFIDYELNQCLQLDKRNPVTDAGAVVGAALESTAPNERELKQGLREIWIKEGKPEMKAFFPALKKYTNQKGSPITAVYTAGKNAGIGYKLSTGTTGELTKKTISNYISTFKSTS